MKKIIILILAILLALVSAPSVQAFTATSDTTTATTCATETNLFVLTVANEGETDTYTVSFSGSAAKWAVAAPMGFILEKGESQQIFVYATPARDALVGSYELNAIITGAKGGVQTVPITLTIKDCHAAELSIAEPSQSICSCTLANYPITLKNTGIWSENFQLSLAGSASPWATLSDTLVRLGAGESKEVFVYAKSDCNNLGKFDVTLFAKSLNSDALASQKLDLEVKGCYDFTLTAPQNFYSFCENTETKIPITIENKGTAANTYKLEVSGPNWAALEQTSASASAGGTSTPTLVLYPAMGAKGDFPIRIKVTSEQGNIISDISLTANIQTCHITDLQLAMSQDKICPRTSKAYEVSLMNAGTFPETYALRVDGADWASLSKNFITLEAGKSEVVDLKVEPGDIAPGNYVLKIIAESQDMSKTSDSKQFIATVAPATDCFGVQVLAEKESAEVVPGLGSLVPIVVRNTGSEEAKFTLDVSGTGASNVRLNPSSLTIAGNSAETVFLYVSVPEQTPKTAYLATVSARSEDGTISSSVTITIRVVEELVTPVEAVNKTVGEQAKVFTKLSTAILGLGEKFKDFGKGIIDKITSAFKLPEKPEENITPVAPVENVTPTNITPAANVTPLENVTPAENITPTNITPLAPVENVTPAAPEKPAENVTPIALPKISLDKFKEQVAPLTALASQYWYVILIILAIIILVVLVLGAGWFEKLEEPDFKDTEFEEVEEEEVKAPKKSQGLWDKFKGWLKEEEPFEEEEKKDTSERAPRAFSKAEGKPKGKKTEETGVWDKFTGWLEEDEVEKEKPKKKGEGAWKKFTGWLTEDTGEPKKEIKKEKPKEKPKKKGSGAWDKFKKFLEEEDEEE